MCAREWDDVGSWSRDRSPHRGRNRSFDNNTNNRDRRDNPRHERGRKDHAGDTQFTPAYLRHLEQRAREHVQKFPVDHPSSSVPAASLISWQRTAVELVMLASKLWGRGRRADPHEVATFASLADGLVGKILAIKEATASEERADGTKQRPMKPGANKTAWAHRDQMSTEVLCQSVALGYSRCPPRHVPDAARRAQALLDWIERLCARRKARNGADDPHLRDVTPSIKLYNHVLSCWARSLDPDAVAHARRLLGRMREGRGTFARPDVISYNNLLTLYANRGNVDAAEELLRQMEQPDHEVSADVYSYSILMNAFQKRFTLSRPGHRDTKDLERAEELLSQMTARYEASGFRDGTLRPSNVTFGTILSMYAQADRTLKKDDQYRNKSRKWKETEDNASTNEGRGAWGARNAERVLEWMIGLSARERRSKGVEGPRASNGEDQSDDGLEAPRHKEGTFNPDHEVIRPSNVHFLTVMDAWAKAGMGVEGAQRCERLLDRLDSLYQKLGDSELQPHPMCYGAVIDAWSKADQKYETAEHAESVLDRMEDLFLHRKSSNRREVLSNVVYNLVIDAWSRRSGSDTAERAESILRRLAGNYQRTNNRFLRPDVITYTAVMKAFVDHPSGGEKALEILDEMKEQYRDGNTKAQPDSQALAVAMDACAKNGRLGEAERIFNDVDHSEQTSAMFNTLLSGYKLEGRGEEAEALLRKMSALADGPGRGRCAPDVISYTLCIEAWGNSKHHDRSSRAKALLDECVARYRGGDEPCRPSTSVFNSTAQCLMTSDDPDRESSILSLFETMEGIGCEPNMVSFNILIKACGLATGSDERKRNALQIAASAYNSLTSVGLRAGTITYVGMIHVMINLMDDSDERMDALAGVFRQCCDDGCLNQWMLDLLAKELSTDQLASLTGVSSNESAPPKLKSLPAEWSHSSTEDEAYHKEVVE